MKMKHTKMYGMQLKQYLEENVQLQTFIFKNNKLDNFGEMDKFLERHRLQKLTEEDTENLNRPIISWKKLVIKKSSHKEKLRLQ